MADIDIMFPTFNRVDFTRFALEQLVANTDWSLVNRVVLWDDWSRGDATGDYLRSVKDQIPVETVLKVGGYGSVVTLMNKFVDLSKAAYFAKVDNDIVVPPGWLNDLWNVMCEFPELDLLGMQSGFTGVRGPAPAQGGTGPHSYEEASHIGGVGLMKRKAFIDRPRMNADGRHGFTIWQERYEPTIGWITPDLHVTCLDQVPFDPWAKLSSYYTQRGWQRQRPWPPYPGSHYTWEWWPDEAKENAS